MTAPTRIDTTRVIRSPRGTELSCKSWLSEALFFDTSPNAHRALQEMRAALALQPRLMPAVSGSIQ